MPDRFTKKPMTVEAVLWQGTNIAEIEEFVGGEWALTDPPETGKHVYTGGVLRLWNTDSRQHVIIPTGDWVVRGVQGELYPISQAVLSESYTREDGSPVE